MLRASLVFWFSLLCISCQPLHAAQSSITKHPDCTGVERWPTSMAFVHLKNAGLTDNERLDFSKTKTVRLASEQLERNLFRQVHHVMFTEKSGKSIEVITLNDASGDECSASNVTVFVVSTTFGK